MAGLIPSFASGATLVIRVGRVQLAYASSLTFVDDVTHAPIGGIGSYSYDALEPTQYVARGSFVLQRYSNVAHAANTAMGDLQSPKNTSPNPARSLLSASVGTESVPDGNSMLWGLQFNPSNLLVGKTFDIQMYEKKSRDELGDIPVFTIKDCRMTGYSISFTPGQTVSENLNFSCILIEDNIVIERVKAAKPASPTQTL